MKADYKVLRPITNPNYVIQIFSTIVNILVIYILILTLILTPIDHSM